MRQTKILYDSTDIAAIIHYDQTTLYNRPHFEIFLKAGNRFEISSDTDAYSELAEEFELGYKYPTTSGKGPKGFKRYYINPSSVAFVVYEYSDYSRVETLIFHFKTNLKLEIDRNSETESYFNEWCVLLNIETIQDKRKST